MTIQLIIDGGADVPKEMMDKYGVLSVALNLHFDDEQLKTDNLDLPTFYDKLKRSSSLPRSSAPSPYDFYEVYKKVDPEKPILVLAISGGVSSTYDSAVMGADMLLEEEPDRKIKVINTKTASCGIALLIHEATTRMEEGYEWNQLVTHMENRAEKVTTLFVLKTLENLIKGGRLDRVKGAIAKTMNIKLILRASLEEGKIEVSEKVRGNKKAIRRFIEQVGEYASNLEDQVIAMSHVNSAERGRTILNDIKEKYKFKDSLFVEMGPLIATYTGESAIVIAFFRD
ncbi:DegV family protein [Thalassobacillus hwangdonensis]|uniref:DegV family protein n=1 Tax=Thalassobacillus hwangdonensis TaxID=546108 RepID=A0ABW3L269_9BACI